MGIMLDGGGGVEQRSHHGDGCGRGGSRQRGSGGCQLLESGGAGGRGPHAEPGDERGAWVGGGGGGGGGGGQRGGKWDLFFCDLFPLL